jgi:hypothetical protein
MYTPTKITCLRGATGQRGKFDTLALDPLLLPILTISSLTVNQEVDSSILSGDVVPFCTFHLLASNVFKQNPCDSTFLILRIGMEDERPW